MTTVAVATYNMSFASDLGLDPDGNGNFASEAAFLKSIPKDGNSMDRRRFYKNALQMVEKFWTEVPNAGVMGFQELNKTDPGSGTGTDSLQQLADRNGLKFATDQIVVGPVKTSVGIMWKPAYFGDYVGHEIRDLDYTPTEVDGVTKQTGRPMLMVKTSKGFVLVSLHAPNQAKLSAATQRDLKDTMKATLELFAPDVPAEKTFLMGDFNDRYDAITSIEVPGGILTYQGKAPLSCCHNWDSSCSDSRYKERPINGRTKIGDCTPPNYDAGVMNSKGMNLGGQPYKLAGPGPRFTLGDEGTIQNYRYYGDKVFGSTPVSNIQIFPPGRTGASKESDHEMVMAEYSIPMEGGYRKRRRHTRKHKVKRHGRGKKHTRKH